MDFRASKTRQRKPNPSPCGYFGDSKKECHCSPRQIENYRQRILAAREDQQQRFIGSSTTTNAAMGPRWAPAPMAGS
jgi:predicted ATPase with chaperone activity